MKKVTMTLDPRDLRNVDKLVDSGAARNKTHAVSIALSLAGYVVEALSKGDSRLLIQTGDKRFERIVMPELEGLVSASADVTVQEEAENRAPA
ncbi:MAG: hypothetical protein AAFR02_00005 [Pseudomonadota bacterium]